MRWSAGTLAVLILGTGGAGYLYYRHLNGNIEKGERSSGDSEARKAEANAAGQTPLNILLIGSDSRDSEAAKDPAAADDRIGVTVQNATRSSTLAPVPGRAGAVTRFLVGKGFTRAAPDTSAALAEDVTVVRHPSAELEGDAQRVAKSLGIPLSSVKHSADVSGVTVVVGADWRSGGTYPQQSDPKAGDLPDNSDEINGADSSPCMDVYQPYRI